MCGVNIIANCEHLPKGYVPEAETFYVGRGKIHGKYIRLCRKCADSLKKMEMKISE